MARPGAVERLVVAAARSTGRALTDYLRSGRRPAVLAPFAFR